jgi:hypothetical protein
MPFMHLASTHKCELPTKRDDHTKLQYGDIWMCDALIQEKGQACGKQYKWVNTQREGDLWMPLAIDSNP